VACDQLPVASFYYLLLTIPSILYNGCMSRSRAIIQVAIIIVAVGVALFFALSYRATLLIEGDYPFSLSIGHSNYQQVGGELSLKLQPGKYQLSASKENYLPNKIDIDLKRREKKNINIQFNFAPQFKSIDDFLLPYHVDPDLKDLAYQDNQVSQYGILSEGSSSAYLRDLPAKINQINFSGQKALVGAEDAFYLYDLPTASKTKLDSRIKYADFLGEDGLIYYYQPVGGRGKISSSDLDNIRYQDYTEVVGISSLKLKAAPNGKQAAFLNLTPTGNDRNLYLLELETKRKQRITEENAVQDFFFTADSSQIVYELSYSGIYTHIWSYDLSSGKKRALGIDVPLSLVVGCSDGSRLYYFKAGEFYEYDLKSGRQTSLQAPSKPEISAKTIQLTPDERFLVLYDGVKWYGLQIKE